MVGRGAGETGDRLRRPPQASTPRISYEQSPPLCSDRTGLLLSARYCRGASLSFYFCSSQTKSRPPVELLGGEVWGGAHSSSHLPLPLRPLGDAQPANCTSPPPSLASTTDLSLSHHPIFLLLMLKLTAALICCYDATPPHSTPQKKFTFPPPSVAFPFVPPPQSLLSFCLSPSCNPPLLLCVTSILIFLQLI